MTATRPRLPCTSPGCRRVFHSEVALRLHLKDAHPAGLAEFRPAIRAAKVEERRIRSDTAEEAGRKRLDSLYRVGCGCGNSFDWHMGQRAKVEAGL